LSYARSPLGARPGQGCAGGRGGEAPWGAAGGWGGGACSQGPRSGTFEVHVGKTLSYPLGRGFRTSPALLLPHYCASASAPSSTAAGSASRIARTTASMMSTLA